MKHVLKEIWLIIFNSVFMYRNNVNIKQNFDHYVICIWLINPIKILCKNFYSTIYLD